MTGTNKGKDLLPGALLIAVVTVTIFFLFLEVVKRLSRP